MRIEDCKIYMKVYFGRTHGEKTLGEIIKINPTKVKVRQLESRGTSKDHPIGTIWTVATSLLTPANQGVVVQFPKVEKLKYNPLDADNPLLEALAGVYMSLSPENLTCDGELSRTQVRARESELRRKMKGIFIALGREIDESEIMDWHMERIKKIPLDQIFEGVAKP